MYIHTYLHIHTHTYVFVYTYNNYQVLDENNKYFPGRIISRDDYEDVRKEHKNLDKIFPLAQHWAMVLILDDNNETWVTPPPPPPHTHARTPTPHIPPGHIGVYIYKCAWC